MKIEERLNDIEKFHLGSAYKSDDKFAELYFKEVRWLLNLARQQQIIIEKQREAISVAHDDLLDWANRDGPNKRWANEFMEKLNETLIETDELQKALEEK